MFVLPAALALSPFFRQAPETPIDVQGRVSKGLCTVPLSCEGRTLTFLIDTGNPRSSLGLAQAQKLSVVLPKPSDYKDRLLAPLGIRVGDLAPDNSGIYLDQEPYDGILGFQLLKNRAFGIDYRTGTVRFWPGTVQASEAMAWVRDGSSSKPVVALSLVPRGDGFYVSTSLGDADVDTGISYSYFPMSTSFKGSTGMHTMTIPESGINLSSSVLIAKDFKAGGFSLPYRSFICNPTRTAGAVAGQTFGSNRVVFDFPDQAIYLSGPDDTAALTDIFSELTDLNIRADSSRVLVEDPDHAGAYLPLVSIDGKAVKDFVAELETGDAQAEKTLAAFYDSYFNGCDLVLQGEGAAKTIHIKAGYPK